MSQSIYKFPLEFDSNGMCQVTLSKTHRILDVQMQGGNAMLWAIVEPESTSFQNYTFRLYTTGNEVITFNGLTFIKTLQHNSLVFHIFYQ